MLRGTLLLSLLATFASCASTSTSPHSGSAAAVMVPEVPGPQHAVLAPFAGLFKAKVVFETPGQPDNVSYGTYDVRWMGAMWLVGTFRSDSATAPFEGTGVMGYDLQTRQYTSSWFDTNSSAPMLSHGTWNPEQHQMIMHGEAGHGKSESLNVTTVKTGDSIDTEVYAAGADGRQRRMMYIEYTRR